VVFDEVDATPVERPPGPESSEPPNGTHRVRVDAAPLLALEGVPVKRGAATAVRVVYEGGALCLEVAP